MSAKVLVAEDNPVNQIVIKKILKQVGAEATVVADGKAAVAAFTSGAFDIVFMDCHMPVMDGYQATAAIRANSQIPIIAMTADTKDEDREKALAAGMTDFISKPVDVEKVRALQ